MAPGRHALSGPAPTEEPKEALLILATISGGIAGVLFNSWTEGALRSPLLLAVTLPVMSLLLFLAELITAGGVQLQPDVRQGIGMRGLMP